MRIFKTYEMVDAVVKFGSFRKASEVMSITSTALNRRVIALEEDLGVEIFERLPHGVRPTVAGEILVDHIRKFYADLDRVKSTIADLSGVRRGHVSIATNLQAAGILPAEIATYREEHPGVTFNAKYSDLVETEDALRDYSADMALVLGGLENKEFLPIYSANLPIIILLPRDHELANRQKLSIGECMQYPLVLPDTQMGVRQVIDQFARSKGLITDPIISSNDVGFILDYILRESVISFLVDPRIFGYPVHSGLSMLEFSGREKPTIKLQLTQLSGKVLSVASAKFAQQLSLRLAEYAP